MRTRRIKIRKARKTRKMTGGKVSKINGKWDFDVRKKPMSTIPKVLAYQRLEIEVLTDLAAECEETSSNKYLKTTQLEEEFKRRCVAATTIQEYEALKVLKTKISQIIQLRTEEGHDKFDIFEDAETKRNRENHEFRVNLWSTKYTIIKRDLNDVRKKLNQTPETDIVFLAAQLDTLGKKRQLIEPEYKKVVANLASIDKVFPDAAKKLAQLQGPLSDIIRRPVEVEQSGIPTDMTAKSIALEEIATKLPEIRTMLADLIFKFRDPLFVAFNAALENFSSKTPEEIEKLSILLEELISYLDNGSEIYATRVRVMRDILASIEQEEQVLQSGEKENEEETERATEALDARPSTKQDKKKGNRAAELQGDVIEEEYQLALQRKAKAEKGEPSDEPSEKAQRYKEANEEFERLIGIIRTGYLEQEVVIKEKAPDIEDLMEIREQLLRVLEMTAISGSKRKKKEKALEQNLKFIVEKNPSYLELVKELDEKLKEILKLGIKADKLEKYMQEHADDIEYIIEPTKESAAEEDEDEWVDEGGGSLLVKQVKERRAPFDADIRENTVKKGTRRKSVKKVEPIRYTRKKVRDSRT